MTTALVARANSLRGCLAHLRTMTGRRQSPSPQEGEDLEVHDPFASDMAKIISSKAFRRLPLKTQVLTGPRNVYIRTRLTHVMEVVADAVIIADILGLNRSLAESIALGHDTGHVPLGHPGEYYLAKHMGKKEFCHEKLGPLMMQKIERRGKGLNLTFETLEGMLRHSGRNVRQGMTQEAFVVRYADKIAYLTADYNDMVKSTRMAYAVPTSVRNIMDRLGPDHRSRTTALMAGLIIESAECGEVSFEHSEEGQMFTALRSAMMEHYPKVTQQNVGEIIDPIMAFLESLNIGNPYLLFALMTDKDVMYLAEHKTLNYEHLQHTTLSEHLDYISEIGELDLCSPHLDW